MRKQLSSHLCCQLENQQRELELQAGQLVFSFTLLVRVPFFSLEPAEQ